MLRYQLTTPYENVRLAGASLLQRLLSTSIIFEHDPTEVGFWIDCLPAAYGNSDDPVDHTERFLVFFEDCLLRCLKTPYKYVEESMAVCAECNNDDLDVPYVPSNGLSPLLFTILEQLRLKISGSHIKAEDCYPVFLFLRRFVILSTSKQPDMRYARRLAGTLADIVVVFADRVDEAGMFEAVVKEARILRACLAFDVSEQRSDGSVLHAAPGKAV